MRKYKNNRGYTLLELIVTLAIVGIVASVVFSFFMTNLKSSNIVLDDTELQSQAQMAMNFITEKVMQSSGIDNNFYIQYIDDDNNVQSVSADSTNKINNLSCIVFNIDGSYGCFSLSEYNLYYTKTVTERYNYNNKNILVQNVDSISIESLTEKSLYETNAFKITIKFAKGNENYSLTNNVYMRNKNS